MFYFLLLVLLIGLAIWNVFNTSLSPVVGATLAVTLGCGVGVIVNKLIW